MLHLWKFHIVSYKPHKHWCFSTHNFEEKVSLSMYCRKNHWGYEKINPSEVPEM